MSGPIAARYRKYAETLGADPAFNVLSIAIIDGGGRTDSEKVADMRALIDVYLADTGQAERLGWLRSSPTPSNPSA